MQYFHIIAGHSGTLHVISATAKNFGLCMDILLCAIISGSVNNIVCGRRVLVSN